MKRIIELAQEELSKEEGLLESLKISRESALNEAFNLQGEIPVQEKKVEALNKALADLYEHYGCPESGMQETVSPAMPSINKGVKPSPARHINRNDIVKKVNDLSPSDYNKAFSFLDGLIDDFD